MSEKSRPPGGLPELNWPDAGNLAESFTRIAERSLGVMEAYLERQRDGDFFQVPDPGVVGNAFLELGGRLMSNPSSLIGAQIRLSQSYALLWQQAYRRMLGETLPPVVEPDPADKRFKEDDWVENAFFDFVKQSYLLSAHALQQTVRDVDGLERHSAEKVEFYTRQFVDALSPTNFVATNPKVLRATMESGGENLVRGLEHLLEDVERGHGKLRLKMTDPQAFEPGRNIAITPGKVVYQTELMQLIQYTPTTDSVHRRPLLIVPPWINKFYILDLRPKNSFIKWCVDQGFTVFVMSWVNPDERLAEKDFVDYLLRGTLAALDAVEEATGERDVNAVSYCLGGTLLLTTMAYLSALGDERIKSATCFTTMLDFREVGELGVFVDEEQIQLVERHMARTGYLEGTHMADAFNLLRANDLIWSFVVNNYLMGREPFPFDLLYWNSDSTRMPRVMHSSYLRNMYQRNRLREPGEIELAGVPIDLGRVRVPAYFLSTRDDHIAPWKATYAGARLPGGKTQFVLGGSGHIAGVINPATSHKYGYWTNSDMPENPEQWLADARYREGSWWPHWLRWVKRRAGRQVEARHPGERGLAALEDAPGSYVKVRI